MPAICIPVGDPRQDVLFAQIERANQLGSLLEICLDHCDPSLSPAECVRRSQLPIGFSYRSPAQGGIGTAGEEERRQQLMQALQVQPAFIELDEVLAQQIPRLGSTQRVLSWGSVHHMPENLAQLPKRAEELEIDLIKIIWPGFVLESVAKLVQALPPLESKPWVGMPIGPLASTFAVLAARWGAPWVMGALDEPAWAGWPSVFDLHEIYRLEVVDPHTLVIGALGFGRWHRAVVDGLNRLCRHQALNLRCVETIAGRLDQLGELLDQLKIPGLVVSPSFSTVPPSVHRAPQDSHDFVRLVATYDALGRHQQWTGSRVWDASVVHTLQQVCLERGLGELRGMPVLLLGDHPRRTAVLERLTHAGAVVSWSVPEQEEIRFCPSCGAEWMPAHSSPTTQSDSGFVAWSSLVSRTCKILVLLQPHLAVGFAPEHLNPLVLKPGRLVLDGTMAEHSDVLVEARARGCHIIPSSRVLAEHLARLLKKLTGQRVSTREVWHILQAEQHPEYQA
ncbi:MAG: hypothetical protein KatS3mg114_0283 [Planctomycetaceae bacterium]|nr:MAG: hypothetical protein KatS3mg114_0283 [Planctomycetaceae bacterium]